jgi:hypothetical protein
MDEKKVKKPKKQQKKGALGGVDDAEKGLFYLPFLW